MREVLSKDGAGATLDAVTSALSRAAVAITPETLTLELGSPEAWMPVECAGRLLAQLGPAAAVTLRASGEPAEHPRFAEIVEAARRSGAMVRVVSRLGNSVGEQLETLDVEVIDVPMVNADGSVDDAAGVAAGRLIDRIKTGAEGLPERWVVSRLTRRDAVYSTLETLYDAWLMRAGACVIEPLPEAIEGERIAPLPVPASARSRREREEVVMGPDGVVRTPGGSLVAVDGMVEVKRGVVAAAEAA
jgi:hypothetical protein